MKSVRSLPVVLSLALGMGTNAAAQTYSFTSCNSQATATIVVGGNLTSQPPVTAFGLTTYTYTFTGTFTLTVGGSTTTTTGFAGISVAFGNLGNGTITGITFGTPPNPTTFLPGWAVYLQGSGTLLTPGVFPATIPPVTDWTEQGVGMNYDYISLNGSTASYYLSCSASGPSGATGATGATGASGASGADGSAPGDTLGDPANQSGCPFCGNSPDPIDLATGNMFERADDYHTFGANRLSFTRYYNSLTAAPTLAVSLGQNWRSNYDRYLQLSSATVIAERPDGQQLTFTQSGGAWTTDTDVDLTLVNSGSTWTLTDHSDTVETYTAISASQALLQTIQSRNGYTQTLLYNSSNQVVSVTDSYSRQLAFTYNNQLLQSVTTPDGLILTYGFSPAGGSNVLTSISYSSTPVTTQSYLYENSSFPFALTGIVDENGTRYMSWTYDSKSRALTSQLAAGAGLTSVAYNDTDGSRTVTGPLGQSGVYHFSTVANVPKVTEIDFTATSTTPAAKMTFTYDTNGYVASRTDWNGNVTTMVNNSRGMPTMIVKAAGTPQSRTTQITYHPSFRIPVQVILPAVTQSFTYDGNGQILTYTLTDTSTNSAPYSTSGQSRKWAFTWSNFVPASIQGPRTDVAALLKFTYDAGGALTSVTNALNQTLRITQHLPGGLPLTIVDQNGVTTTLSYDVRQRLLTRTLATGAGPLTTQYTYDAAGNTMTTTLPDGSAFNNTYDGAHRLTGIADLLEQSIGYTRNAGGGITAMNLTNGSGNTTLERSHAYDALGRPTATTGGAGQTTSYAYDPNGNVTSITDGLNHTRERSFDALNRLVKVTDPTQAVSTATYDPFSRPLSVSDANGATTQYTYDGFGDLIQEISPASGTTIYHFDGSGNMTQKVDARGVVANYSYDALDRLTSIAYPGNSAENVTLTYDQNSFGVGRLTSVTDAAGSLTRSYDERGNLLSESRTQGSTTLATAYTYDAASRIVSMTYPSRWTVSLTRDQMGRITSAAATAPGATTSHLLFSAAGYEPFGPVSALTYGNGITEKRTYDADYRLTGIAATVEKLSYSYDAADNVLSIADGVSAANSQSFGFDILNRLASASGAYGRLDYSYDANGNRSTESSPATSDGLASVTSFAYNQAGRLAAAYDGDQSLAQYTYDVFGHRLVESGNIAGTTHYQYASDGTLLEEADGQGNLQVDYVYLNRTPLATIQGDGTFHYLHNDRLGAPQAVTDASQSVMWSTTYQPFGQIANAPSLVAEDLRLPGQETDPETGLYHNGFRDYAPGIGRYVQSDPVGLAAGTNRYAYAGGNPAGEIDPSGLLFESITSAINQASSLCQGFGDCSLSSQVKIAYSLATSQQTPYVPALPSDIGPPAPPTTQNLTPLLQCSAMNTCTPETYAQVIAAQTAVLWQQIYTYNSTLYSQVVVPTFEQSVENAEFAFTAAAGAPQWGVPQLVEIPEEAEALTSVLSFAMSDSADLYPGAEFGIPGSSSLLMMGATGVKLTGQGFGAIPCPFAGGGQE